ncbi:HDIG domain-containing protein [candidate division KSB1 bacterium]|nr:HDIG domain-containing protein [candidate division KSB1 bacterium]
MKHKVNILHNRFNKSNNTGSRDRKGDGNRHTLGELLKQYKYQILGLILLSIVTAWMFPREKTFQFADLKEGRVYIGPEIIATFTFAVNKSPEEYAADVKKAQQSIAPIFRRDDSVTVEQQQQLRDFLEQFTQALRETDNEFAKVKSLFQDNGIIVTDEDVELLIRPDEATDDRSSGSRPSRFMGTTVMQRVRPITSTVLAIMSEIYTAGVLDIEKEQLTPTPAKLSIRHAEREMLENADFCYGMKEAQNYILDQLRNEVNFTEPRVKIAYQIATRFLQPNLFYNEAETRARIEEAVALVPLAKDQVLAGERIIEGHERITKEHIDKLNSYAIAKAERRREEGVVSRVMLGSGKLATTILIFSIFIAFIWLARRHIIDTSRHLLLIGIVALLMVALTFLINQLNLSPYLIPVTTGAMIVTIFFDAYTGILYILSISLLLGTMRGNEYGITFVTLFVSSFAILSVTRVRKRNWVLRSIAVIMVAYAAAITVLDLLNYISLKDLMSNLGFGLINGFLSPIFAYALIVIFENVFDMTTDMTLLELSDLNHPLLRQLAMEAPGTYHHSITVGYLAEAAAEAIGGNSLLARVGAYYHDIGKIEKPEYFVENQGRGRNPQEKLTPTMSSLVLLNHVRRGAEMARQYGLPAVVEAFIYEHHGTGLMNYFYQKAVEQSEGEPVSQNAFRYPGPRPRTRETAIVMLADSVEAATRSLRDPSPSRIKTVVEQIIDERFKSGELDDTPLTLHDLSRISEAFQKIIYGTFHRRIEYPKSVAKNKDV